MKKYLWIPFIAVLLYAIQSQAATIQNIYGAAVSGPINDFPSVVSLLCDGSGANLNCPQYFHPQWNDTDQENLWGVTNRVNPPICIRSTDGGITWVACTTQPFVAGVLSLGARMAVAANGAIIFAAGQGANTCIIRRSTDNGVSWSTVFTSAVQVCSVEFGSPTPPQLYCSENGGYCAHVREAGGNMTVIYSTDNGANWTVGTSFAYLTTDNRVSGPTLNADGSDGRAVTGINAITGQPFAIKSGSDFIATGNYVPAVNVNCFPLLMGSDFRMMCTRNGVSDSTLRYVNPAVVPLEINTFSISPALPSAQNIMPIGYSATTGYVILIDIAAPSQLTVYASVDSFASAVLLTRITPTTAPIAFCCNGNTFKWGNRLYFSSGASGSNAFLGIIE